MYLLGKETEGGRYFKLEKGIYSEEPMVPLAAILSYKYKHAVLCGLYALYHHGMTDVVPETYELSTDRDAAKIRDERVKQIFMNKEILYVGARKEDVDGYSVMIYDKERTLVELLRNKSSLPYDIYKECIRSYRKMITSLDIKKVEEYALLCPKSGLTLRRLGDEVL